MSLNKVWLSFIDYRPDPGAPEKDRIALGCILEARLGHGRECSLAARIALTEAELGVMDGIGRELLAHPNEFLMREINRFLERSIDTMPFEDGGMLRALSQEHSWSLYVSPPRAIRIESELGQTNRQALHAINEKLFGARLLGREVPLSRPLKAGWIVPDDWREQVPPAWQISVSAPAQPHVQL